MKHLYLPLLSVTLLAGQVASAQVRVNNGASLVISSGANVVLNDISLQQGNTAITGDGKLLFTGISALNTISSNSTINNLNINKSAGISVNLSSNLALNGTLQLTNGNFNLNVYDLNLGTTGSLNGESESNYITGSAGFIISEAQLNAPTNASPGNLGFTITSDANLGSTIIKRGHYASFDGSNYSIKRFFDVYPTNNVNLNATVKFKYLDAELNSLAENQLQLLKSVNAGINWSKITAATLNSTNNEMEATGLASLNRFTLANNFTTLPLSGIYLNAKKIANGVALSWNTINEINVNHFLVEKSTDSKRYSEISNVTSLSQLKKDNLYQAFDKNPIKGYNYYRIKAVDNDGTITTSLPLAINFDLADDNLFKIFPNPTTKLLNGSFYAENHASTQLQVISNLGKVEISRKVDAKIGLNDFSVDVSMLPTGIYYLKLSSQNNQQTLKFIKN